MASYFLIARPIAIKMQAPITETIIFPIIPDPYNPKIPSEMLPTIPPIIPMHRVDYAFFRMNPFSIGKRFLIRFSE